jgi:hypothetical protein
MKYLKNFESFNESYNAKINESEDIMQKIESSVKAGIAKLDNKEKQEVAIEMTQLAKKLGLSMEDMADPKKVAEALHKTKAIKESEETDDFEDFEDLDEGEKWDKVKTKIGKFLTWSGAGATLGGLISLSMSVENTSKMTNLLDYVPDGMQGIPTLAALGMVGIAAGIAAIALGMNLAPINTK